MTDTESALFTVRLARGTKTVSFDDVTRWIAEAKNPPPESLDEYGLELLGADWVREESELETAVRRGEVEVLDSSYHALRPPFSSHKLEKSVLTVKAFRLYVEAIKGAVEFADTQQPAPVVTAGASDGVEPAKAGPLPIEGGLLTKEIADTFAGVNKWSADRWLRNLSASKWLHPARMALGCAGGASSVWNPLTLAQLMHSKAKDSKQKEQLMKSLNSRFNRNPVLMPWRDAFNEYYATHCATD